MQNLLKKGFLLILLPAFLSLAFSSYSASPTGGDVLEVYLNQNLLVRQYLYQDKEVRTISLANAGTGDELKVHYGHCGINGKNRSISILNDNNTLVKKWNYADAPGTAKSLMKCNISDILNYEKTHHSPLGLYYTSAEMPEAKRLVTITMGNANP